MADMAMDMTGRDEHYMACALELARRARDAGEVPVGAVAVLNDEIIGRGYNRPIGASDPSAHAEMLAIREAAQTLGNYRLNGATLYATLEPCAMCTGAIIHARIARLVFAAHDEKTGAVGGAVDLLQSPLANHHCQVTAGIFEAESATLLREFFASKR